MVENPDVSSGGLPTNKTRMERTPKTIDGLVQEEIFLPPVSVISHFKTKCQPQGSLPRRCGAEIVAQRDTHFLSKCSTTTVERSLQTQFAVSSLLSGMKAFT